VSRSTFYKGLQLQNNWRRHEVAGEMWKGGKYEILKK
jgi:hypothetical protein